MERQAVEEALLDEARERGGRAGRDLRRQLEGEAALARVDHDRVRLARVEVGQVRLRLVSADFAVHRAPSRGVVALLVAAAPYKQDEDGQQDEEPAHATASRARRTSASAISTL